MMQTIPELLAKQELLNGSEMAILSDSVNLTWSELADLTWRMSSYIHSLGIKPGQHVALICSNRPAFIVAWLGLANAGIVTVSLNTSLVGESLDYVLQNSQAQALIIEEDLLTEKKADLDKIDTELKIISFSNDKTFFEKLTQFDAAKVFEGSGSDPVSIIYTSGTTGRPKGVLNSHQVFAASGNMLAKNMAITKTDRFMVFLPLFHTNPQMYAVMSALQTGCSLALIKKFSVSNFFNDARRFKCTIFTYVGTVLSMLASRITKSETEHNLTRCVGGGCPPEIWEIIQQRFGIKPFELYGMSEIGGWVTSNSTTDYKFGSCGKQRADIEVKIFDKDDYEMDPGEIGQIVVRPKQPFTIMLGYWQNAQASWESASNFWFHTGDLGYMDKDGYLFFKGRLNEVIRRGGENIAPAEIELILLRHTLIKDAYLVVVPDDIYGQEIKAVIVVNDGFQLNDIVSFLNANLPKYMVPRYIQIAAAIPRTETQKIQRNLLIKDNDSVIDIKNMDKNISYHFESS